MVNRGIEWRQNEIEWIVNKHFADRLNSPEINGATPCGHGNSLTAQEIYDIFMADDHFKTLAEGNADREKYPTDSEVELAIANRLCSLTGGDLDKTMEVLRMLPIYSQVKQENGRSKWERTFPVYAWPKAMASCAGKYYQTAKYMFGSEEVQHTRQEYEDQIKAETNFDALLLIAGEIHESRLPESHKDLLIKMISRKAGVTLKSLKSDLAKSSGGDDDSIHYATALRVIKDIGSGNIIFAKGCFYKWDGDRGVWVEVDDRRIKQIIHKMAPRAKLSQAAVSSILDLVKTECFKQDHQFNRDKTGINCINGVLQWDDGKFTLMPHNKDDYCTIQIPIEYDPDATAPRYEQFLREITEGDAEQNEKIWLLLQLIGYCLVAVTRFEAFFFFIGPGANGKSVFMSLIKMLVGPKNVAAVQPSQLGNKFQRAHLDNKLVNLVTEVEVGHLVDDAALKAITSGEITTVEKKFVGPFEIEPFATCIFGTNHLPHTRDFSNALQRRAYIISFSRVFSPEEQDKSLTNKLAGELPGILNLALKGLGRLYTDDGFTRVQEVEDARKDWQMESDQVAQFIESVGELGPDFKDPIDEVYMTYRRWGHDAGISRLLTKTKFIARLRRFGIHSVKGAKGKRFLKGVKIRDDCKIDYGLS